MKDAINFWAFADRPDAEHRNPPELVGLECKASKR